MDLETGDVAKKNQIFFCRDAIDFSSQQHRSNTNAVVEFFELVATPFRLVQPTLSDMN